MARKNLNANTARIILKGLKDRGVEVSNGLDDIEISRIERSLHAQIPPDLKIFIQCGVPIAHEGNVGVFPQWHGNVEEEVKKMQEHIENAFIFDIKESGYWNHVFGTKPQNIQNAVDQAVKVIREWPPLLRIYGHRYIPTSPSEFGNPIISVWQAVDSVYFACDLVDFFVKEFKIEVPHHEETAFRNVPYWSEAFGLLSQK